MTTSHGGPDEPGSTEDQLIAAESAGPPATMSRSSEIDRYAAISRAAATSSLAAVKTAAGTSAQTLRRTTEQHNVLAIVALTVVAVSPLTAGILAPVGAILGHLSLRQLRTRQQQTGKGMARAAVIIGWTLTFAAPCIALGALLGTFSAIAGIITSLAGIFS